MHEVQEGMTRPATTPHAPRFALVPEPPAAGPTRLELMTLQDVQAKVKLGKSMIYQSIKAGTFPAPRKVGAAARWRSDEVDDWIRSLPI